MGDHLVQPRRRRGRSGDRRPLAAPRPVDDGRRSGWRSSPLASIGCAASWSLPALIVFRCVQGLGARVPAGDLDLAPGRPRRLPRAGHLALDERRRARGRARAGARRRAHPALRLAGDLRRPGAASRVSPCSPPPPVRSRSRARSTAARPRRPGRGHRARARLRRARRRALPCGAARDHRLGTRADRRCRRGQRPPGCDPRGTPCGEGSETVAGRRRRCAPARRRPAGARAAAAGLEPARRRGARLLRARDRARSAGADQGRAPPGHGPRPERGDHRLRPARRSRARLGARRAAADQLAGPCRPAGAARRDEGDPRCERAAAEEGADRPVPARRPAVGAEG